MTIPQPNNPNKPQTTLIATIQQILNTQTNNQQVPINQNLNTIKETPSKQTKQHPSQQTKQATYETNPAHQSKPNQSNKTTNQRNPTINSSKQANPNPQNNKAVAQNNHQQTSIKLKQDVQTKTKS